MVQLSKTLTDLSSANKKALVAYIVAGDPTPETTVPLMHTLVEAGVDVIELGMPFSDPEAEGPVIQLAHERALAHNVSLRHCLEMATEFRKSNSSTPIVLMGYLNPIEFIGYQQFAKQAEAAGISGTIIVNLPPEESGEMDSVLEAHNIEPVYLLAPTTTDERAEIVCRASRGFVYYVSLKGTTGASTLDIDDVSEKMARFRKISSLPIMVGFGVKDGASAKAVAGVADGAVVGSAIVKLMEEHRDNPDLLQQSVKQFVGELRAAID
ncbi:MAG: tryptophan synthase subunit alpha [Pseudomonadales bacterium]|nr:tryptophan synthase subunit alpha [Pseudomonadales bacterium]MBO6566408.1 tryptophan synthase subunit alpha [Pseudomonadales bacterium]MBO6595039.1 tryptophan synthase subunit alpha [Pseudomonadales bacterium]MBO6821402.1 tryptophan synthase subunit alpha [Pseudomonadales bacterium]